MNSVTVHISALPCFVVANMSSGTSRPVRTYSRRPSKKETSQITPQSSIGESSQSTRKRQAARTDTESDTENDDDIPTSKKSLQSRKRFKTPSAQPEASTSALPSKHLTFSTPRKSQSSSVSVAIYFEGVCSNRYLKSLDERGRSKARQDDDWKTDKVSPVQGPAYTINRKYLTRMTGQHMFTIYR